MNLEDVVKPVEIKVKYEGQKFFMGGQEYIIPALSVKMGKKLWPKIVALNAGITTSTLPEKYSDIIEIVHAAITRNYPDMTIDELEDLIDMTNIRRVLLAAVGQSGFLRPGPEPAAALETMIAT